MVVVAQLVRAPDCGSGGRGFKSHLPPKVQRDPAHGRVFYLDRSNQMCHLNLRWKNKQVHT